MITTEKLDSYYTPRSAEERARIRKNLAEVLPKGDIFLSSAVLRGIEEQEAKLDHLMGDADDADA